MKLCCALLLAAASLAWSQPPIERKDEIAPRLPGGRNQTEEILKAEHSKSLEDAAELIKLSEAVKAELEKSDRHIVSVGTLKKLEEIEKLSKRIRGRLRRF